MSHMDRARAFLAQRRSEQADGINVVDVVDVVSPPTANPAVNCIAIDAETLHSHLTRLYVPIKEGCLAGLHRYPNRVPAEVVKGVIAAAGPGANEDDYMALCQRAGEAVMLAALIDEFRFQLALLQSLDADGAFRHAAALELCLANTAGPASAGDPLAAAAMDDQGGGA